MFTCFSNLATDFFIICGIASWVGDLIAQTVNSAGRRLWSRRPALGWPLASSQEERLS